MMFQSTHFAGDVINFFLLGYYCLILLFLWRSDAPQNKKWVLIVGEVVAALLICFVLLIQFHWFNQRYLITTITFFSKVSHRTWLPKRKLRKHFANPRMRKKFDQDRGLYEASLSAGVSGPLRAGVLPLGVLNKMFNFPSGRVKNSISEKLH